jgi:acetyl esterase/lipase
MRWLTPLFAQRTQFAGLRNLQGLITILLFAVVGCRVTDLRLWTVPETLSRDVHEVERVSGVCYYDGPDTDARQHRLDLFLPKGEKAFPVVVLVHGGVWMIGDNRCCGLYSSVGEFLASRGIGAVLPNYRLSPQVQHPEHVRDVARAFAWTRAHIAGHGGSPRQLFLLGHSAGGHLVSLLATDEQYLKAEGCQIADIRGVISVSGVYRIPEGDVEVTLGGATPRALRWDKILPLRHGSASRQPLLPGIPLSLNVFGPPFGEDAGVRRDASPINHVRSGLPPFLLVVADNDLPTLPEMAGEFQQALREHNNEVDFHRIPERNHHSIMFSAIQTDDPVAGTTLEFIRRHLASVGE